ncbi:DUF418 domain-containing protein [Amycolatopsis decaplanina]|uniref:DUF418 domain-containing protein n=1 Tax=Amycolatopsis decaplanina DSM 44594 TaxID=1284240 RepID=M2XBS2_9PSEU|nr:DUF418 domain-containing protein [Amycolatopsis decaplanina]EME58576.1 hypothetical protein H074_18393 [Amycolatopsis decaplanina DSM 44594]
MTYRTSAVAAARHSRGGRISSLDLLRGVAILGTFGTNVFLFAHPGGPAGFFQDFVGTATSFVERAEVGLRVLTNGKFLALLTILFGVGLELQYQSARRRGVPWPGRYPLRAGILFLEGVAHFLLVFEGDVLMAYGLTSLLVAYLVGRSDRVVRNVVVVVGGTYAALLLAATASLVAAPEVSGEPAPVDPSATAGWPAQVAVRLNEFLLLRAEIVLIVPSAVVLFLLGSRLRRAGVFDDTVKGGRLRARLLILGFAVGLPLNVLTGFSGPDWLLVDRYLLPPLVALGLLALVTHLTLRMRGEPGFVRSGLIAVGRTALSCYVLQNLLAGALCYGWGLGLAERFADARPWWIVGLWGFVGLVNVAFAVAWLRRFERGPLELLMHRLYAPRPADRRGPREW